MEISPRRNPRQILSRHLNSIPSKCILLAAIALLIRALFVTNLFPNQNNALPLPHSQFPIRNDRFVDVPQIVWGLNNQKIALARSLLTARLLNRTLLIPSLSASLFYKETHLLKPISFDKLFDLNKFNSLCHGFVKIGNLSDLPGGTRVVELRKGSGRKWTKERDLEQLEAHKWGPLDGYELIRIVGKNPFLWHDHWPVSDYAKVFECLVLVDGIMSEADRVVSRIRELGLSSGSSGYVPYMAVHMRLEKDWMLHCKNVEKRRNVSDICSSKDEIVSRVGKIAGLGTSPTLVYVAVADELLEDESILSGWGEGLVPFEKRKLGVDQIYQKYPYLIQSAIDFEVCSRSDVFVGNSFSTFSSLVVLDRTQRMLRSGFVGSCKGRESELRWRSYAYNVLEDSNGPKMWMTKMSDTSLVDVSYGTNEISSC